MAIHKMGNKNCLVVLIFIFLYLLTSDSMVYSEELDARKFTRPTLRGIKGIFVLIENLSEEVEKSGVTRDQIKTDVELKLRMAGIKVISKEESFLVLGMPYLYVNVSSMKNRYGLFCLNIKVSLDQGVRLVREPRIELTLGTWEIITLATVGEDNLTQVRSTIKDLVDIFINDYLAVNPK